jgi:enoyl-[acyl-carrier protein] reductase/trans-2-enoyl-CoA reductase (NAD+)
MLIEPKVRGFICLTAHPEGCKANVEEQIRHVLSKGPIKHGPKKVLVIGASTGYGLASRIAATFGSDADTLGVYFERPAEPGKTASPGWYNTSAFTELARAKGRWVGNINGDAFSDAIKKQTIDSIKANLGKVDLVVYSLASPRRTHPKTGEVFSSVLRPIGAEYTNKTVDTTKGLVKDISITPASDDEIRQTIGVMGGEDWEMWMKDLADAGVLAPGVTTVAYSYIGPKLTFPIYKNGTIGRAKEDLERACQVIATSLKPTGGRAYISVNKALVTQASSAIPVVPLYIALLYKIMKAKGLHEGCIEQMDRLFREQLYTGSAPKLDEGGRIRVDDWEMKNEIQTEIEKLWPQVTTENINDLSDLAGYQADFLKLFGFGMAGVDYQAESNPDVVIN